MALLVLLFGNLQRHFSSFSRVRQPNHPLSASQAKAGVHYQAHVSRSEVGEKASAPADQYVLVEMQIKNIYALSPKD